ncbi:hypothetical protein H4N54_05855, partial [Limnospira fusiformis KN01]
KDKAFQDALAVGLSDDDIPLNKGGNGARAYSEAIAVYLAFGVSRLANRSSSICFWDTKGENVQQVFARQAIPMNWDFTEGNPFSSSSGNFLGQLDYLTKVLENTLILIKSYVFQHNAPVANSSDTTTKIISTDPPYYDNIGYADLSDFFYVWLRQSLGSIYPDICSTLLVPKSQELIAAPHRFGGEKNKARDFFEAGLMQAFKRMNSIADANYPLTVYYAFKQAETDAKDNVASTGWETMLEGLMQANFSIGGTWPMRTELIGNLKKNVSALASSIVLVCRPRGENAAKTTKRKFLSELQNELPQALKTLQEGNIAPVDLAQASIGPGMAIYSKYSEVLENDGSKLTVRSALQLINQLLDEYLTDQEGEFDSDTRWA